MQILLDTASDGLCNGTGFFQVSNRCGAIRHQGIHADSAWYGIGWIMQRDAVRRDALDHFLLFSEKQVRGIVSEYVDYYNTMRPHQGIHRIPECGDIPTVGKIQKKPVLWGLHHHYYKDSAWYGIGWIMQRDGDLHADSAWYGIGWIMQRDGLNGMHPFGFLYQ